MLQFRTVFPCGLNERLGDEFKTPEREVLIGKKSPSLSRIHHRVCRGSHDTKVVVHPSEFISKFNSPILNDLLNVFNFLRIPMISLKKATLTKLLNSSTNY